MPAIIAVLSFVTGMALVFSINRFNSRKTKSEAENYAKLMLDTTPLCCQLWDNNYQIIDCNDAAVKFYGFNNKQEYIERFFDCSPEYQSDGQRSDEKAKMLVKKAFEEGKCTFDWMHQIPETKEPVPAQVTLARTSYKDGFVVAAYTYDLRNIRKMEESIRYLEKEKEKIYYDPLTGIYNRRYFDKHLPIQIKSLSRSGGTLSIMMIDIDHFKRYNDTYGHGEGDRCLRIVANTLSKCVTRADDFVARYGGEEFVVVLPNTNGGGAIIIAEKLIEKIQACRIPHKNSDAANYVTISIGVTSGIVDHSQTEENYIKLADEMLYASKQNGRNRYTFSAL